MVSPDGTKIAFRHGSAIYVMNIDGSNPVKVSANLNGPTKHSWAPDSVWVLFNASKCASEDECGQNIFKVRYNGKDLTQLTDDGEDFATIGRHGVRTGNGLVITMATTPGSMKGRVIKILYGLCRPMDQVRDFWSRV